MSSSGLKQAYSGRSPDLEKHAPIAIAASLTLALVFIAKVWLIDAYGSPVPYWDQWDAEAARLYKDWQDGNFSVAHLFETHNEHRIAATRLVHLSLFEATGKKWNPLLQMQFNAFLHGLSIVLFLLFIQMALPALSLWALWGFAALLFAIPFGWENALAGFQSQFYLLLLLSVGLLWACAIAPSSKAMVVGTLVLAILLPLTMAGGSLAVMAGATVLLARRFLLKERISLALPLLLFAIAVAGILATPSIEGHAGLKAQSLVPFVVALGALAAWPVLPKSANAATALLPILMQAPLALGLLVAYQRRKTEPRSFLLFFAMACWLCLQMAAVAYGRGLHCLESRYLDILAFGLVTNFAALLFLWSKSTDRWRPALSALWLAALVYGFWAWWPMMSKDISEKAAFSRIQEGNVRGYLTTGQRHWLYDAAFLEIPYPSPERLQQLLDDETIRNILPRQLFESVTASQLGGVLSPEAAAP